MRVLIQLESWAIPSSRGVIGSHAVYLAPQMLLWTVFLVFPQSVSSIMRIGLIYVGRNLWRSCLEAGQLLRDTSSWAFNISKDRDARMGAGSWEEQNQDNWQKLTEWIFHTIWCHLEQWNWSCWLWCCLGTGWALAGDKQLHTTFFFFFLFFLLDYLYLNPWILSLLTFFILSLTRMMNSVWWLGACWVIPQQSFWHPIRGSKGWDNYVTRTSERTDLFKTIFSVLLITMVITIVLETSKLYSILWMQSQKSHTENVNHFLWLSNDCLVNAASSCCPSLLPQQKAVSLLWQQCMLLYRIDLTRTVQLEETFKDHLVQLPDLFRANQKLLRDEASTTLLFQHLTTLTIKKFFLTSSLNFT